MAKSKSFFGLRKGSTKSLTFSVLRGVQITKDRVTEVANPQSRDQMVQRVAFATATQAAEKLLPLIGISWENITNQVDSKRAFVSVNSKLLRTLSTRLSPLHNVRAVYAPKGNQQLIPNSYQVSRGSLVLPSVFVPKTATGDGTNHNGTSFANSTYASLGTLPALPLGTYTVAELWQRLFSLQPGDQLTFPQIYGDTGSYVQALFDGAGNILDKTIFTEFMAPRLVLQSEMPATTVTIAVGDADLEAKVRQALISGIDGEQTYTVLSQLFTDAIQLDEVTEDEGAVFYIPATYEGAFAINAPNGDHICAIGCILSRKDTNGKWRYSTSSLCCVWDWLALNSGNDYYGFQIDNAIATYMKTVKQDAEGNFLQSGGEDDILV